MANRKLVDILTEKAKQCDHFSMLNDNLSKKYKRTNTIFNVINITVTSLSGTLLAIITSTDANNTAATGVLISSAMMSFLSAIINTVQQQFKYEQLAEKVSTTSNRFRALANNIERTLALADERENLDEYFRWATNEYDSISFNSDNPNEALGNNKDVKKIIVENEVKIDCAQERPRLPMNTRVKYEIDRFIVNSLNISK